MLRSLSKSFINLLYPPACLHCNGGMRDDAHLLCKNCLSSLEIIDSTERCPYCFSMDYEAEKRLCADCLSKAPLLHGIAAAFDYIGPAATLIRKLKYSDQPYLSEGCGAYLALQFMQLGWPQPDLIVPMPIAFTHWFERGYNQSLLLAQSLSKLIDCPVQDVLLRGSGDYSQAGLRRNQRMLLDGSSFSMRAGSGLRGKKILLVDDVMTTGSTMRKCAEVLMEDSPDSVYGLTFCRALR